MLLNQLVFAASAAAFLIVPEVSGPGHDIVNTLPVQADSFGLPSTAYAQSLDLPCWQCHGHNTHLKMNFAVEDGSRLTLNGFELYPNADPWRGDLTASVSNGEGDEQELRLGYSLAVHPEGMDKDQQMEVIGVELRIIEIGNRFVHGIPSIKAKLVKAPTSEILIGSVAMAEPHCQTLWCYVKHSFGRVFHTFGGCPKSRHGHGKHGHHGHGRPGEMDGHTGPHGHHDHHGPPGPPPHGMGHGADAHSPYDNMAHDGTDDRSPYDEIDNQGPDGPPSHDNMGMRRQWRHLFKDLAFHIFLPVLMGITAGFGVAVLIMALCSVVFRLSQVFRGNQEHKSWRCVLLRTSKRTHASEYLEDEKSGLMENQHLPQYQDEDPSTKN